MCVFVFVKVVISFDHCGWKDVSSGHEVDNEIIGVAGLTGPIDLIWINYGVVADLLSGLPGYNMSTSRSLAGYYGIGGAVFHRPKA